MKNEESRRVLITAIRKAETDQEQTSNEYLEAMTQKELADYYLALLIGITRSA